MTEYDFIIIGGGIIGLATARQLQREFHGAKIAILEKEALLAMHQTGHNSGVVHAGVYYAPGSLKARFLQGRKPGYQRILPRTRHSLQRDW